APKLEDSAFEIYGSSDATKIAKFEVDGLTTATTRTYTLPDNDGTVALKSDVNGWLTGTLTDNVIIDGSVDGWYFYYRGDQGKLNFGVADASIFMRTYYTSPYAPYDGFLTYDFDKPNLIVKLGITKGTQASPTGFRGFGVDGTSSTGGVFVTLGSDTTGDTYYRDSSGYLERLPIGTE